MDLSAFHISLPLQDPTWIFLVVLLIILFAPILFERLRIPQVVGMILAGLLIGEHGLGILARDGSFELFGQVGLYYIMLLAGLEMNISGLRRNRLKALTLGLLCFTVPVVVGVVTNRLLLGYGVATSVLLASMYASNTQVSYPIVGRYGLTGERCVSIAVGGTAVTDTLTLLVLALVGGMFKGESGQPLLILVLKVLVLGSVIIFVFPRLARFFFRRYEGSVPQFVFVLALAFLGAGLMMFVGMQGILGVFMTGLVLNRFIPKVSALMNHLEFVGGALFIPFFLIGVGMLVDLKVLFGHVEAILVAVVMITVALGGKWVSCFLTQHIFKMEPLERKLMFGLSTAQAAATLAAVMVGYNIILPDGSRLLNEDVLNGTILLILLTCLVSGMLTDKAARQMAMDESRIVRDDKDTLEERMMVPMANPDNMEGLMEAALWMRDVHQKDNVFAMSVLNEEKGDEAKDRQARQRLERMARLAAASQVRLISSVRYGLNTASSIIHAAKEYEATDMLLGLHRRSNMMDSFFGSVTESLIRSLSLEVMVLKMIMPMNTIHRIVVAVPPRAEYEAGFMRWVHQMGRLGGQVGCRVHFFATLQTQVYLRNILKVRHPQTRTEFSLLESWDDFLMLSSHVNYDHLLVCVTARRGAISYDPAFERLPQELSRYFMNNSLMVIFPSQEGDTSRLKFFSLGTQGQQTPLYERLGRWMYRIMKK